MTRPAVLTLDQRRTVAAFTNQLEEIKARFVERDGPVDVIAHALLCGEHILLVGPPGTAKTALVEDVRQMLGARYFSHLLTRFTEPAELFGAIDVNLFRNESTYRVNTEGMIPHAEIAFLDEIFNGSSAILNTLLALINERVFYNGSQRQRSELVTLLGATNELSEDPVLQAFCDRFLFRIRLDYVADENVEEVLELGWQAERGTRADDATFPMADLRALQAVLPAIDLSNVRPALAAVLRACREEAIAFSDRRAVKAQKAIAASALLHGREQAEDNDLAVLANMWSRAADEKALRVVLEGHGVEVTAAGSRARDPLEIRIDIQRFRRTLDTAGLAEELRELSRRLGLLANEVRSTYPADAALLREVQNTQRATLEKLSETGM
jgi:MoxR-like ATPase